MSGSAISLGLGLGGGKSATSSGRAAGGNGAWNGNTYSLNLDGVNDYLNLGSGFTTTNQFTISAWIKPDNLSTGYGYLVGNNSGTGISLDEGGGAAGAGKFYLWTGSGTVDVLSTTALTINNWFHLVFVCDKTVGTKGEIKFYINGSLDKTTTLSNQDLKNITLLSYIGYSPSHYFNGQVDEVAIFNSALSSSNVASIYNSGVPSDISSLNPVGWWRMGDNNSGSGTTITDQGSGGNDGTLINGPTFSRTVPSFSNQFSLDFDGLDDYVDCGGASTFSFTDGSGNDSPFSISAWVKMDSIDRARLVSKDTSTSSREYLFGTNNSNKFNMLLGTATVNLDIRNNTTLNASDWFHVVATYDGSKSASGLKVFVNADASNLTDNSAGTYAGMPLTGGSLEIGRFANGHSFFNGLVDEVAIFDRELSASDVTIIYNNGRPFDISSFNPVAWFRMGDSDGGSGNTITNAAPASSSNNINASIVNGTLGNTSPNYSSSVPS